MGWSLFTFSVLRYPEANPGVRMSRTLPPKQVLPHLRRTQALIDGSVSDPSVPAHLLRKAKNSQKSGPLAGPLKVAQESWQQASAQFQQARHAEDQINQEVHSAQLHLRTVKENLVESLSQNPWPQVAPLVVALRIHTENHANASARYQELSAWSEKELQTLRSLGAVRSWAAYGVLNAHLATPPKPTGWAGWAARRLGVEQLGLSAAKNYQELGEVVVQMSDSKTAIEATEKQIEQSVETHPDHTAARQALAEVGANRVRAQLEREKAQEIERLAYRRVSDAMRAQWKDPDFVGLAAAVSRLPGGTVRELDRRIEQRYGSASAPSSPSPVLDPFSAVVPGVLWWTLLSDSQTASANPVLQDKELLSAVSTVVASEGASHNDYTTGSAFQTGGGFGGHGPSHHEPAPSDWGSHAPSHSPSPSYDHSPPPSYSPSPSYDHSPSPSPSYDSSPSYSSSDSSSSYGSGGDF